MKQQILSILFIVILSFLLSGCLVSGKEYKPLYQVEPEKESLKPKD